LWDSAVIDFVARTLAIPPRSRKKLPVLLLSDFSEFWLSVEETFLSCQAFCALKHEKIVGFVIVALEDAASRLFRLLI
jgi:hypothetical protein